MSELLTATGLIALSVSKIEAAIDEGTYDAETLAEALEIELARDDMRKTAVEAIEDTLCDVLKAEILSIDANATFVERDSSINLRAQLAKVKATLADLKELADAKTETGYKVPKGKAMTTLAGIKSGGQEITAKMVVGGGDTLTALFKKGLLE